MSAYIVEDITINRIISGLVKSFNHDSRYPGVPLMIGPMIASCQFAELGQKMADMNRRAVNQRYNERTKQITFNYTPMSTVERIQVFKSLGCFLYQCCEGNVPRSRLYKVLREYEGDLARSIVFSHPTYEASEWG